MVPICLTGAIYIIIELCMMVLGDRHPAQNTCVVVQHTSSLAAYADVT